MKGKYLISTDEWFFAPDGREYRAAWGNVEIMEDSMIGVKTNRNSTNWYAKIGSQDKHVIIAGCQIFYAIKCEVKPNDGESVYWTTHEGKCIMSKRPSQIYIAE